MGLLKVQDWKAKWIEPEDEVEFSKPAPVCYIRKKFYVKHGLVRARAYQTAHGLYQYWMNGTEAAKRKFAPGNTSYYKRLQYQTDDLTELLTPGENVWAVQLADGWWRGACGAMSVRNNYGDKVQFLGQLVLEYADGSVETIISDENMVAATGGFLMADMKLGSIFDAALEPDGWKEPDFNDENWKHVHLGDGGYGDFSTLIGKRSVDVLEKELLDAKVLIDAEGSLVLVLDKTLPDMSG